MIKRPYRYWTTVFVLGIAVLTGVPGPLDAQTQDRVVVQVDPLENRSDEARLDPLGIAIRDGVSLTLRLLGRYEVVTDTPASPSHAADDLQERAIRDGVDNIIFGTTSQLEDGGYRIALSVYDRVENDITFQDEVTFGSLLDSFGVVDDITLSMVEGFSGIRLTFGALRFDPPAGGEVVTVFVDGVDIGSGEAGLDRVPAGEHEIVVRQERPLGAWESRRTVTVATDQTVTVSLQTPVLTADEAVLLDGAVAQRQSALVNGTVSTPPDRAVLDLLDSDFFQTYRRALAQRYRERIDADTLRLDGGVDDEEPALERTFPGWFTHSDIEILRRFRYTPTATGTVTGHLGLIDSGDPAFGTYVPPFRAIVVDGDGADWEGVEPLTDYTDDWDRLILDDPTAADVVEVRIAHDYENLYLMFRTADRRYRRRDLGYKFHFDTPTARVFIDHWPAEDAKPWIGYMVRAGGQDYEWNTMRNGTRTALTEGSAESVLETALPLEAFVEWTHFGPSFTDLWSASEYRGTGDHESADRVREVPNITRLVFPIASYLAVHE